MMKTRSRTIVATGCAIAIGITLTVLRGQNQQSERSKRPFLEKAYEVLDNPKWYENNPFLSQEPIEGEPAPMGRPSYSPSAIEGTELSCILGVVGEYVTDPSIGERLERYAEHHNRKVAIQSVAALVRGKRWTREQAIAFAEEREWSPAETQEMLRASRTALETAHEILDNSRWYEDDPLISGHLAAGKDDEATRTRVKTLIERQERDAIVTVFGEYMQNPAEGDRLKKYAQHHNPAVAALAVAALVRSGEWTKESAIEFAQQRGWAPPAIEEMIRVAGTGMER